MSSACCGLWGTIFDIRLLADIRLYDEIPPQKDFVCPLIFFWTDAAGKKVVLSEIEKKIFSTTKIRRHNTAFPDNGNVVVTLAPICHSAR